MSSMNHKSQSGDTLVEVLLVTAIMSMIVVGAYLLMNRAFGGTQAALEHTIVRHAIEGQVEQLTYARDQFIKAPGTPAANAWTDALARADTSVSPYGACLTGTDSGRFYLEMVKQVDDSIVIDFNTNPTMPTHIASPGRGVWVEAYRPNATVNYVDFHVYGCWDSPIPGPRLTTGTVVRLYVP